MEINIESGKQKEKEKKNSRWAPSMLPAHQLRYTGKMVKHIIL